MTEETKNRLLEEAACLISVANGKKIQRISFVENAWIDADPAHIQTPLSDSRTLRLKPEPRILYGVYVGGNLKATAQIADEGWDATIDYIAKRYGEDCEMIKFIEEL